MRLLLRLISTMDVLAKMYETMPCVPSLVYFSRKLNKGADKEDNYANTKATMNSLIQMMAETDFDELEARHLEFLKSSDSESQYTVSSDTKETSGFMAEKVASVAEQLRQINELDKKLTTAIYAVDEKIRHAKQSLDMGAGITDQFSMAQNQEPTDFSTLFEDKPVQLPNSDRLDLTAPYAPPGFERQIDIP